MKERLRVKNTADCGVKRGLNIDLSNVEAQGDLSNGSFSARMGKEPGRRG